MGLQVQVYEEIIRTVDLIGGQLTRITARKILNRDEIREGLGLSKTLFKGIEFWPAGCGGHYYMRVEDQGLENRDLQELFDMRHGDPREGYDIPLEEIIRAANLKDFPLGIIREVQVDEKTFEILLPTIEGLKANNIELDKILGGNYGNGIGRYLLVDVPIEQQADLLEAINSKLRPSERFGFPNYLATLRALGMELCTYKKTGMVFKYEERIYRDLSKREIISLDVAEEEKFPEKGIYFNSPQIIALEQFRKDPKQSTILLEDPDGFLDIDESLRSHMAKGIIFGRIKST